MKKAEPVAVGMLLRSDIRRAVASLMIKWAPGFTVPPWIAGQNSGFAICGSFGTGLVE